MVAKQVEEVHGVQTRVIAADFNTCQSEPAEFHKRIFDQCQNIDVSILVNNVGTAIPDNDRFHTSNVEDNIRMMNLNIFPQTFLCY
jgi:short-subunit dehydrogenase